MCSTTTDFFTEAAIDLHGTADQLQRQEKLLDVKIGKIDKNNKCGTLGTTNYTTTLFKCTCKDFKDRHLPCKHIYRLALELGIYKMTRIKRSSALIADFSTGYAEGWKFSIPTCFRDSLDIKLMPRATGEKDEYGKPIFKNEWTQGELYCFHEGAILYNDKIAYEASWGDALKSLEYMIQVDKVTPSSNKASIIFDNGQLINNIDIRYGTIRFKLYKPLIDKDGIEYINTLECPQDKFVVFLKTGILKTTSTEMKV